MEPLDSSWKAFINPAVHAVALKLDVNLVRGWFSIHWPTSNSSRSTRSALLPPVGNQLSHCLVVGWGGAFNKKELLIIIYLLDGASNTAMDTTGFG